MIAPIQILKSPQQLYFQDLVESRGRETLHQATYLDWQ